MCLTIKLLVDHHQNEAHFSHKWKMGPCYGPKEHLKDKSKINTYIDRCCVAPGVYTLTCRNDMGPFGWGNSFLEISGQRYCDDFIGYEGFRRISIEGT